VAEAGIDGVENLLCERKVIIVLIEIESLENRGIREARERGTGAENKTEKTGGVTVPCALSGGRVDVLPDPGALSLGAGAFASGKVAGRAEIAAERVIDYPVLSPSLASHCA